MPHARASLGVRSDLTFEMPSSASDLVLAVTADSSSPIVGQFFDDYDRAFVLPNEKEELAGFKECLDLNSGSEYDELIRRYGLFREVVFVARDAGVGNAVIGGGNFIAFPLSAAGDPAVADCLCANLNYIYVVPGARGRGYLRKLIQAVNEIAAHLFVVHSSPRWPAIFGKTTASGPVVLPRLVFLEQNDPLRMTAEDYARDTEHAGVDQFDRLRMWARLGARIVDFPYVQPPLSSDQSADDTLLYAVLGVQGSHIEPALLKAHLERFFGISVLKGANPDSEASAVRQFEALEALQRAGGRVQLLDPLPWLDARHERGERGPVQLPQHASFRDLIRA